MLDIHVNTNLHFRLKSLTYIIKIIVRIFSCTLLKRVENLAAVVATSQLQIRTE